jgi:hypothetical protein
MARFYQGDAVCECGKDVPVFKTGGGMLTTSCGWCRKQEHCPEGSTSYRKMQEKLKLGFNPDEEPKKIIVKPAIEAKQKKLLEEVKEAPKEAPKEAAKDKTIFDIFG